MGVGVRRAACVEHGETTIYDTPRLVTLPPRRWITLTLSPLRCRCRLSRSVRAAKGLVGGAGTTLAGSVIVDSWRSWSRFTYTARRSDAPGALAAEGIGWRVYLLGRVSLPLASTIGRPAD